MLVVGGRTTVDVDRVGYALGPKQLRSRISCRRLITGYGRLDFKYLQKMLLVSTEYSAWSTEPWEPAKRIRNRILNIKEIRDWGGLILALCVLGLSNDSIRTVIVVVSIFRSPECVSAEIWYAFREL